MCACLCEGERDGVGANLIGNLQGVIKVTARQSIQKVFAGESFLDLDNLFDAD